MNTADIKKMTLIERLQAMELLWDSLIHDHELESPEWHKKVLQNRKKSLEPKKMVSLAEVKKTFSR